MLPVMDDLPPIDTQRGGDPTLLRDELGYVIADAILAHPRSQQQAIGPSQLGTPCDRKLGFALAHTPPATEPSPAWRPQVGTAVHSWLAEILDAANTASGFVRWLTERRVDVGYIGDELISGTTDIYDRLTCTVVDWKVCGASSLRQYRANGPGQQYQVQGHLYGRGWTQRGLPVDRIAWYFLPMAGELHDAVWFSEPYDEAIAWAALERAAVIRKAQLALNPQQVNALLPTAQDHCTYCAWHKPGPIANPGQACPGHVQPLGRPA